MKKNLNLTICMQCSNLSCEGKRYCSDLCKNARICPKCCIWPALDSECQYCNGEGKKVRCITCQRRVINPSLKYFCGTKCSKAVRCPCDRGPVWLDFGEHYSLRCLNCIWEMLPNIENDDELYGRPPHVAILIQFNSSVLVHKRGKGMSYEGKFAINSGKLNKSDYSSRDCAIRELAEETSIDVSNLEARLLRISKYHYCIDLTEKDFIYLMELEIKPQEKFQYEIDSSFGYQFLNSARFKNKEDCSVMQTIGVYSRFKTYATEYDEIVIKAHTLEELVELFSRRLVLPELSHKSIVLPLISIPLEPDSNIDG